MRTRTSERGLTLIEMIVVIAILGVLVGVAVPYISEFRDDGMRREQKTQFSRIQEAYRLWLQVELMQSPQLEGTADQLFTQFLPNGVGMNDSSMVSKAVLEGTAGPAYLSYWTPQNFKDIDNSPSNAAFVFLDEWGNALQLTVSAPGLLQSLGSDGLGTNKVSASLPAAEILQAEAKFRKTVIDQAIRAYFASNFLQHPSLWTDYGSGSSKSAWNKLTASGGTLNTDDRWKGDSNAALDVSFDPVATGDWLHVQMDVQVP